MNWGKKATEFGTVQKRRVDNLFTRVTRPGSREWLGAAWVVAFTVVLARFVYHELKSDGSSIFNYKANDFDKASIKKWNDSVTLGKYPGLNGIDEYFHEDLISGPETVKVDKRNR